MRRCSNPPTMARTRPAPNSPTPEASLARSRLHPSRFAKWPVVVLEMFAAAGSRSGPSQNSKTSWSRFLREMLPKIGDFITGWRPVRVACVTVEHQRAGLQRFFEFFLTERNCLVVVVRTDNFELQSVAHEPSSLLRDLSSFCIAPFDAIPGSN